jgi:hypothetical protein
MTLEYTHVLLFTYDACRIEEVNGRVTISFTGKDA